MSELRRLSGSEVARLVRTRKVSAREVADAALERLDSVNPRITAIARWAPIPLRLIVGFGFIQHGFAKLSKGPDTFAAILHALAVPAPHFVVWITDGAARRLSNTSGRLRVPSESADGSAFVSGDFYCASALRV
jgi:hypothetical protein